MKVAALLLFALLSSQPTCHEKDYPVPEKPDFHTSMAISDDYAVICKSHPKTVACVGHPGTLLKFKEVDLVWGSYMRLYAYHSHTFQGGDKHTTMVRCGDCADFAFTMSDLLAADGQAGSGMAGQYMTICDKRGCDAHMTLWVLTSDKGWVEMDEGDEPAPIHMKVWGSREAITVLDGKRVITPFSGFSYSYGLISPESEK